MQIYKRVRFTKKELNELTKQCEGYIWAVVDTKKYVISLGDEYLADLRDVLICKRCNLEDIYGVGIDLKTGEINYVAQINRRNPSVGVKGELDMRSKEEVEDVLGYFFEKAPFFSANHE